MTMAEAQKSNARRYDLDWVRVIAMLMLLLFHSGRFFDFDPWHLKNVETGLAFAAYNHFFNYWGMQLFFLVAGAAVWFSLGTRKTGPFVKERVLRILVPLLFGILLVVPPQVYLERIYEGQFSGSFFQFYPHFFEGTYSGSYAGSGNFSWHHLWFLAYLFTFTLLALPLFLWLRRPSGEKA
ncbi:MAG: acyltransferase, partial [Chloroflexi bacterium]|nr:acyltransferase [Chloroflexota bacterium]